MANAEPMFPIGTPYISIRDVMGIKYLIGYMRVDRSFNPKGYQERIADYRQNRKDRKEADDLSHIS